MNEKQRWLLRDLELWRDGTMVKIGKYGPRSKSKEPSRVKAARKSQSKAAAIIRAWEESKDRPWKAEKAAIDKQVNEVRRTILFCSTEVALKAIRGLKS